LSPMRLEPLRLVNLLDLHGNYQDINVRLVGASLHRWR